VTKFAQQRLSVLELARELGNVAEASQRCSDAFLDAPQRKRRFSQAPSSVCPARAPSHHKPAPPEKGLLYLANLAHRLCDRHARSLLNFTLTKL